MQILTVIKSATSILIIKIVSNINFSSFFNQYNIFYHTKTEMYMLFFNYFPVAPGILSLRSGIVISTRAKGDVVV